MFICLKKSNYTHQFIHIKYIFILGIITLSISTMVAADDWPGFRGPDANGISKENVISEDNSYKLSIVWKNKIGSGYSGIAIAEGYVVTMFSDGKFDVAITFCERTGKELWRFEIEPTVIDRVCSHHGPLSTPLINHGHVYGLGAGGRLFSLELKTGKLIWSIDLTKDFGATSPFYGFTTSPIIVDQILIIALGMKDAAVVGIDPSTGLHLWSSGSDGVHHQSPILFTYRNGEREIIFAGNRNVFGITPQAGKVTWKYKHYNTGTHCNSPIPVNQNRMFLYDPNGESILLELEQCEDSTVVHHLWENEVFLSSYNLPIYKDGYLFGYVSSLLTCIDASNGDLVWQIPNSDPGFFILVGNHLVIITQYGQLQIVKASPDGYQEIAQLDVLDHLDWNNTTWCHPSFANGHIFVRSLAEIARVKITPLGKNITSSRNQKTQSGCYE